MSGAYYNEIDPFCAEWLKRLMLFGHIAPGEIDTRSIEDVRPDDLRGFTQCHFFAGIGVWSYALRCAGWPDDAAVWTGSCPCQPFSAAGQGGGFDDERHLWPAWHWLIAQCRPPVVFGEQVASKDGLAWLDLVHADMEGANYAVGALDLCAAGVGAPHIRQRLYFVADSNGGNAGCGANGELADSDSARREGRDRGTIASGEQQSAVDTVRRGASYWSACDWLPCTDGKARPVESGTFPLAHGAPARVGRLRAYGNAIVAPLATEFIKAYLEC